MEEVEKERASQDIMMWSIWMFTIPSLRAKECMPKEKDALNVLFVITPLMNVILPFVWKSFAFIFSADVIALVAVYYWKGAFMEVRFKSSLYLIQKQKFRDRAQTRSFPA
eukprot:1161180-Pelagomonas_calceolata.AAC.6